LPSSGNCRAIQMSSSCAVIGLCSSSRPEIIDWALCPPRGRVGSRLLHGMA
jgi:hypothetical protein